MKIAFLVLAHTDPAHIARLARVLTAEPDFDVYIHVDEKKDKAPFQQAVGTCEQSFFTEQRVNVSWAGYSMMEAEFILLRTAMRNRPYDRYVFLQGLDYPIKSNRQIKDFFENNRETEFVRCCEITHSKDRYFWAKCSAWFFYENRNFLKRCINFLSLKVIPFKTRKGYVLENGEKICFYYGAAQWAITQAFATYLLQFERSHPRFNQRCRNMFAPDESYIQSVIAQSPFRKKMSKGGPEPEKRELTSWRNLHYFTTSKGDGRIDYWGASGFEELRARPELFVRKTDTAHSQALLDLLDAWHEETESQKRSNDDKRCLKERV